MTLETNDASAPTAQLTIHAIVKPYVEAYPAGFVRFMLLQGDVDTQSIKLYSEEEEPFEIKEIQVPGDWVKVARTGSPQRTRTAGPADDRTQGWSGTA